MDNKYNNTKWTVAAKRADFAAIGECFNIDPVVARVIRNRDIEGEENIRRYLYPSYDNTYDPSLMLDMDKGCRIIYDKIKNKKHIRIISDYDVDGIMSNYILYKGLLEAGAIVSYEIPDRMLDGYGINERIIEDAKKDEVDTIITCDNGIAAFDAIRLAKSYGMTVVVTDHHVLKYTIDESGNKQYCLVDADAIIDTQQENCEYPFKGLCGAGVAYKFIRNLHRMMQLPWEDNDKYIDMLALATVCDVMDLRDENRVYVKQGLRVVERTTNIGLRALIKENDLTGKTIVSHHLGFILGPCLNASGRLESAKRGLELLLCEDASEAENIARELVEINNKRKKMTEDGVEQAILLVEECYMEDKILVIYLPGLHESIAGIVAGRVREHYDRPTLIMTDAAGGYLKGSARSIDCYDINEGMSECAELFVKFGGHKLAAGFTIEKDKLDDIRIKMNANCRLTWEEMTPVVRLDVPMPVSYITPELVDQLALLEPFGKGNPKPLFGQSGLRIKRARLLGDSKQYIKITFMDENGYCIDCMDFDSNSFIQAIKMWFSVEECDKMLCGQPNDICIDVAYYPEINEYMGRKSVQLKASMYRRH